MAQSNPTLYERLTVVDSVGSIGREAEKLTAVHNILLLHLKQDKGTSSSPVGKTIIKAINGLEKDRDKAQKQYQEKISKFYDMAFMAPSDVVFPHACFFRNPDGHYTVMPFPTVDIPAIQSSIMGKYEKNPVFKDAAEGKKTIEDTFGELSAINKGIKIFLPRRKNEWHNAWLGHFSELARCGYDLRTDGLFSPRCFVSGASYAALVGTCSSMLIHSPETTIGSIVAGVVVSSLLVGALFHMIYRVESPQKISTIDQAKYLDTKIQEIYAAAKSA